MKTYNLHEIMSNAWAMYRKWVAPYKYNHSRIPSCYTFAKTAAKKAAAGIVRMHYSQYKAEYSKCQTVEGSYDKATKTIEVMTKTVRTFERPAYTAARTTRRPSVTAIRGLCPRCHTYCYGDCMA